MPNFIRGGELKELLALDLFLCPPGQENVDMYITLAYLSVCRGVTGEFIPLSLGIHKQNGIVVSGVEEQQLHDHMLWVEKQW